MHRTAPPSAPAARLRAPLAASALAGLALAGLSSFAGGARAPAPAADDGVDEAALGAARATISEDELRAHVELLASEELEGRDSPSAGLDAAATYLEQQLASYGYEGVGERGSFRLAFTRALPAPDPERCELVLLEPESGGGDAAAAPALGRDFVPLPGCTGEGVGPTVFVGFGIDRKGYDDFARRKLAGAVAVLVAGEPRHARVFDGPDEVTDAADVYAKVEALVREDVAGVLVVRRPPARAGVGPDGEPLPPPPLGYRYTWAAWNPATVVEGPRQRRSFRTPVLEVTPALAERLLGVDVLALAEKADSSGKPIRSRAEGGRVRVAAGFRNERVQIENVAGLLRGSDPLLAGEVVVLGAHYDHVGVDPRGRVAYGADDNASGTAAMLEVAQALGQAPPRRSVLVAFFGAEEDGLLGSAAMADAPPVPRDRLVAMLNMDMVGRGVADQVVVLGTEQNPDLEEVLERAARLRGTGIDDVVTDRAQHLWERSDHYSFHRAGVPVLFFFEAVSETLNPDYHTFRDTVDQLDFEKIANTARLCLHVAWLLGNADGRPGDPRR